MPTSERGAAEPQDDFEWVESKGWPATFYVLTGFFSALCTVSDLWLFHAGGPDAVWAGLRFMPHLGKLDDVVVVWGLMIGLPLTAALSILSVRERRIGVGTRGVRVECWLGGRTILWANLAPDSYRPTPPPQDWTGFTDLKPGPLRMVFGIVAFYASQDQMGAMLSHPSAPAWRFPQAVRLWAGLWQS